ncbi:hypothetical protein BDN72DRAFT_897767 [Pluteus cervinus]|uniref:Uncharacterized protein n=1 Tax=Pluteus cervinus TaxID=181527 RepID=A0ACD3ATM7_9AGAR|nr:hypothetical protein BDN72DRAFT_897767 [Pluteus cervinus]
MLEGVGYAILASYPTIDRNRYHHHSDFVHQTIQVHHSSFVVHPPLIIAIPEAALSLIATIFNLLAVPSLNHSIARNRHSVSPHIVIFDRQILFKTIIIALSAPFPSIHRHIRVQYAITHVQRLPNLIYAEIELLSTSNHPEASTDFATMQFESKSISTTSST